MSSGKRREDIKAAEEAESEAEARFVAVAEAGDEGSAAGTRIGGRDLVNRRQVLATKRGRTVMGELDKAKFPPSEREGSDPHVFQLHQPAPT